MVVEKVEEERKRIWRWVKRRRRRRKCEMKR